MINQCALFSPDPDQAALLAAHMPIGGVFDSAREQGTTFNDLLKGLGAELFRVEQEIFNVCRELDPRLTIDLIEDWERSVGIPNGCFTTTGDLTTRRQQVLVLLEGFRVQTAQDFIDLAAVFNEVVEIEPGGLRGAYPMLYPALYLGSAKAARFTMIVHFPNSEDLSYPQDYPVPYGIPTGIVECLINSAAPANVNVIFSYGTTAP